jgi:hypothetical protein
MLIEIILISLLVILVILVSVLLYWLWDFREKVETELPQVKKHTKQIREQKEKMEKAIVEDTKNFFINENPEALKSFPNVASQIKANPNNIGLLGSIFSNNSMFTTLLLKGIGLSDENMYEFMNTMGIPATAQPFVQKMLFSGLGALGDKAISKLTAPKIPKFNESELEGIDEQFLTEKDIKFEEKDRREKKEVYTGF